MTKKHGPDVGKPGTEAGSPRASAKKRGTETVGGREFGNVIEPTQAQMASGNRGLAAGTAKPKKRVVRKKAA